MDPIGNRTLDGATLVRRARWREAVGAAATGTAAHDPVLDPARWDELLDDLVARHTEPHRRHHTLDHVDRVLVEIDLLADLATEPALVRLAAWYHDAVYDPTRSDNEERSADLAIVALRDLRLSPIAMGEIARLVRVTADHRPDDDDRDGAVLCDADLSVLGAAPDDYDRYAAAVREEYAHLGDEPWQAGRASVLEALLARSSIFTTSRQAGRLEEAARDNLNRELGTLR